MYLIKKAKENKRELGSLEKIAKYKVSFSEDYDEAFESTKFWRATAIENAFNLDINDPRELEQRAKEEVPDETLRNLYRLLLQLKTQSKQ